MSDDLIFTNNDNLDDYAVHVTFDPMHKGMSVPSVGVFDEPHCCVPINRLWADRILPALIRVGHSDIWDGTPEEKLHAFQQIDCLVGTIMACDCGTGVSEYISTTYNQSDINTFNSDAQTRYNTYTTINPELIGGGNASPSTTVDQTLTDNALCASMHLVTELFRDLYLRLSRQVEQVQGEWTKLAEQQTDVAAKITALYATTFGIVFPQTVALPAATTATFAVIEEITRFLEGTDEVITETDLGDDWVSDMACYLYTNLVDKEITFNLWRSVAMDRGEILPIFVEHTTTAQEASAASEVWIGYANDLEMYFGIMEIIDVAVDTAFASGSIIDCPCCDIIPTTLQTLKMFPVPDNTSNTPWPGYTGHNVFETEENFYIPSTSFAHHDEFPSNRIVMEFDPPIRITNDIRLRIIHLGGGAATHTLRTITNCGFTTTTKAVGAGGGSTNETILVSLPYLSQSTAEKVRRIEFRYKATNNQPLILAYVEIRAQLIP